MPQIRDEKGAESVVRHEADFLVSEKRKSRKFSQLLLLSTSKPSNNKHFNELNEQLNGNKQFLFIIYVSILLAQ